MDLIGKKIGKGIAFYIGKRDAIIVRMFIEVSIREEEREEIKEWADKEEIKMPRAYAEAIRRGMKVIKDAKASDENLERYDRELGAEAKKSLG